MRQEEYKALVQAAREADLVAYFSATASRSNAKARNIM